MRIITSFEALDLDESYLEEIQDGTADMNEIRSDVFEAIQYDYESATRNTEAYLSENYEEECFIFGAVDADRLKNVVKNWNLEIKRQFLKALKSVWKKDMTPEELPMDTLETYNLWKSARELDNSWWYDTEYSVYLSDGHGYSYFRVTLDAQMEEEILRNPEKFIIVDVCVRT